MQKKCENNATELLGLHLHFSKNAISKSICNFGKSHFSKNAISIFRTTFVKTHFLENAKCNDHRNLYFFLARILDEAPARPQCNQSLGKVWGLKFPGPGPSPSPSPNLPVFLRLKATAYRPLTLAVAYLKLRIDLPHIVFFSGSTSGILQRLASCGPWFVIAKRSLARFWWPSCGRWQSCSIVAASR